MTPFPPKKKFPPKPGVGIVPAKPKPAMDDLESPDPVEGKPAPDPAEEATESPDEESSEDYGAKLVADIEAAGKSMGMDAATSRTAAGAFFKAAADCLGGDGEDSGLDEGSGDDGATGEPMGGRYGR